MALSDASEFTNTYTSFSGCDMVCSFGSQIIGELQGISYSVTREKVPCYTMGSSNPRSFSRGKRGIAGTLVFAMFDHDALLKGLEEHIKKNLITSVGNGINWATKANNGNPLTIEEWDRQMSDIANQASGNTTTEQMGTRTAAIATKGVPRIVDEIPPFDITISMANEYGKAAVMVLYGVEILNSGSQFSVDQIMSQMACTFAARMLKTLRAVNINTGKTVDYYGEDGKLNQAVA